MGTHPNGFKKFDWSRTDCDIWMFNEAPSAKDEKKKLKYPNISAFFQMHNEAIWKSPKNRTDKNHYKWLASGKTPTAYMQEKYREVPKSVRYPIESVSSLVKNVRIVAKGKEKKFRFFSSSPDFALALVAQMWKQGKKYERVEIWGIELELETEYRYQRTGFGFWCGYLAALGVNLVINNSIFDSPMYGYEGDIEIPSKVIKKRISDLSKELGDDKALYNKNANNFLESLSELVTKDISDDIEGRLNKLMEQAKQTAILNGKIKESTRYLGKALAMEKKAGISVFAPGEFDSTRISYNKQYLEVQVDATNLNTHIGILMRRLLNMKRGSQKRQSAVDEIGIQIANLMNKNILLLHIVGGIQENQFYLDSAKLSISLGGSK